eukprot:3019039-Pyramimonas_sp.AAC.1
MASKTALDHPQEGPQPAQRGLQDSFRRPLTGQEPIKMAQGGPKGPQEASKTAQEASKRASRKARKGNILDCP